MRIAIFETEHFEGAFPIIRLFDMPGNTITICTTPATQKRFADLLGSSFSKYQWSVLPAENKRKFFYSLFKTLRKQPPDLLYLNTVSNNHILYAFVLFLLRLKRVVMTVHDINCLFESKGNGTPKSWGIHVGKKWLIRQVDEFNVVSDTMTAYLRTRTKKPTHAIPGAVFEHHQVKQTSVRPLQIIVPGSIDPRRRDYEKVFELASLAKQDNLSLQFVLLGGAQGDYGKKVVERANTLFGDGMIKTYEQDVVDQHEFDRQMDLAHFIFIPSVIHTKICGSIPETYGITKSSGNIFDVVKHAKPFIAPADLEVSANLQSSCFQYRSLPEILNFLKSVINTPATYLPWEKAAFDNSLHYTIEVTRAKNPALFGDR